MIFIRRALLGAPHFRVVWSCMVQIRYIALLLFVLLVVSSSLWITLHDYSQPLCVDGGSIKFAQVISTKVCSVLCWWWSCFGEGVYLVAKPFTYTMLAPSTGKPINFPLLHSTTNAQQVPWLVLYVMYGGDSMGTVASPNVPTIVKEPWDALCVLLFAYHCFCRMGRHEG